MALPDLTAEPWATIFVPKSWYFQVGADTTKLWSSSAGAYVPAGAQPVQDWMKRNGGESQVMKVDDETDLRTVLAAPFTVRPYGARKTARPALTTAQTAAYERIRHEVMSQSKLSNAFVMASAGHWQDGTPWKCADGSFLPLAAADVQKLAVGVSGYVGACYAREAALFSQPGLDVTTGWPSNVINP
jgi:hypothetical protein